MSLALIRMAMPGPTLLDKSHPVASLSGKWYQAAPFCQWISDHELLTFRADPPGKDTARLRMIVIDTASQNEIPRTDLDKALEIPYREGLCPRLSPDRTKLLLTQTAGGSPTYIECDLKSGQLQTWNIVGDNRSSATLWSSDGNSWFEVRNPLFSGTPQIIARRLGSTTREIRCSNAPQGNAIGLDARGALLFFEIDNTLKGHSSYLLHSIIPNAGSSPANTVSLPVGATSNDSQARLPNPRYWHDHDDEVAEIQVSPTRDRLAYLSFDSGGGFRYPLVIRRLMPRLSTERRPNRVGLWVCNTDGSNDHEIGLLELKIFNSQLTGLQWLPDGKSISYVCGGQLWVVPVVSAN